MVGRRWHTGSGSEGECGASSGAPCPDLQMVHRPAKKGGGAGGRWGGGAWGWPGAWGQGSGAVMSSRRAQRPCVNIQPGAWGQGSGAVKSSRRAHATHPWRVGWVVGDAWASPALGLWEAQGASSTGGVGSSSGPAGSSCGGRAGGLGKQAPGGSPSSRPVDIWARRRRPRRAVIEREQIRRGARAPARTVHAAAPMR